MLRNQNFKKRNTNLHTSQVVASAKHFCLPTNILAWRTRTFTGGSGICSMMSLNSADLFRILTVTDEYLNTLARVCAVLKNLRWRLCPGFRLLGRSALLRLFPMMLTWQLLKIKWAKQKQKFSQSARSLSTPKNFAIFLTSCRELREGQ